VLAPEAVEGMPALKASVRAVVRSALEIHLRHERGKTSRSRIKRLRGVRRPEFRLRVGGTRVFYDISGSTVEILAIVTKSEADVWLRKYRRSCVRRIPLSEIQNDLSRFIREAEGEAIVVTRDGKAAGLLVGFASEDDWFEYQLENDPRFLRRIEDARKSPRAGRGVRIEDVQSEPES